MNTGIVVLVALTLVLCVAIINTKAILFMILALAVLAGAAILLGNRKAVPVEREEIQTDDKGLPILDQFSNEDFVDLCFRIRDMKKTENALSFHMEASWHGEAVGVDVHFPEGIQGNLDGDRPLRRSGVVFSRSGAGSDRLVAAIAELYRMEIPVKRMVERESYELIEMDTGHSAPEHESSMQLLGNAGGSDQDGYEIFLVTDTQNGLVFWKEKSHESREPLLRNREALLRALTAKAGI